jgi:hypothetical protein
VFDYSNGEAFAQCRARIGDSFRSQALRVAAENALQKARRRTKHPLKYSDSSRASRRFFGPSISDYSIQHAERTEIRPEPVWNLTIVLDGEY